MKFAPTWHKSWSSFLMETPIQFEMDKCWFFYLNENISGPFTPAEINFKIAAAGPETQCLVWTKGQKQWTAAATWQSNFAEIVSQLPKPASEIEDWYVGHNDRTQGPISQTELIKYLRTVESFEWEAVRIWKKGQETWSKIFNYPDILEEIGGSRRIYIRVPLNGTVMVSKDSEEQIGRCTSISLGGMGVMGLKNLSNADVIKLTIKCDEFGSPVYCSAVVRYITEEEVGMQFQNLHMEFQSRISDYIKKFQASTTTEKAAA